jgi:DNA-binding response OmpR family regulator
MSGDETTLDHKEWNGADDCIVKPFESAELLQKISSRSQNLIPGT